MMDKWFDVVQKRISVRSYGERKVEPEVRKRIEELACDFSNAGPFRARVHFRLLDLQDSDTGEIQNMVTYGVIKGAYLFILGTTGEEKMALIDLGYCLEKIILHLTKAGLGTCWLGGTFKRASFAEKLNLAYDELLPAITPVGYPAREKSAVERVLRFGAGSNRRKNWTELFFKGRAMEPLKENESGIYRDAFEAVRVGPSASNKQPWRLMLDNEGSTHLFLKENKLYNRLMGKIKIQLIDMGIAMCHFELVAKDLGLQGTWAVKEQEPQIAGLQYIATWS
jgi:nitroreductase